MDEESLLELSLNSTYELLKASVRKSYQVKLRLPAPRMDCRCFLKTNHRGEYEISSWNLETTCAVPEMKWFLFYLSRNPDIFPKYRRLEQKAMALCCEVTSRLDPKRELSIEHWFNVTCTGKALWETEASWFWFTKTFLKKEMLADDKSKRALLAMKCLVYYVLDQFLAQFSSWDKEEELPEVTYTCVMYIYQSQPPRFTGTCRDSSSPLEWFLFYLSNFSQHSSEYDKLVSAAKVPCVRFTHALLCDLKVLDRARLDVLDKQYPHDCEVNISLKGDVVTVTTRRFKGGRWRKRRELKPVKATMGSIVLYAQKSFMKQTEATRALLGAETESLWDHGKTDELGTVTLTAHNVSDKSYVLVGSDVRARLACPTRSEPSSSLLWLDSRQAARQTALE